MKSKLEEVREYVIKNNRTKSQIISDEVLKDLNKGQEELYQLGMASIYAVIEACHIKGYSIDEIVEGIYKEGVILSDRVLRYKEAYKSELLKSLERR